MLMMRAATGSQISYIGSPLLVPTWVIFNILASVVFWIWIITPALYYSNTWLSAYLPLQSNSIFDDTAKVYNVSRVIDAKEGFIFDEAKFDAYSTVSPPSFVRNYADLVLMKVL
jgi:hypothetical protein